MDTRKTPRVELQVDLDCRVRGHHAAVEIPDLLHRHGLSGEGEAADLSDRILSARSAEATLAPLLQDIYRPALDTGRRRAADTGLIVQAAKAEVAA